MKAFVVVGPESSGTRLLTEAIIRAGVFGQSTHSQEMDNLNFSGRPDLIVLRRSVPHGTSWPDLTQIVRGMSEAGYEVVPIVAFRDKDFCVQSQLHLARQLAAHQGMPPDLIAEATVRVLYYKAYRHIFKHLTACSVFPVICDYTSFVNDVEFRKLFFDQLGLPCPQLELYDADLKYPDLALGTAAGPA